MIEGKGWAYIEVEDVDLETQDARVKKAVAVVYFEISLVAIHAEAFNGIVAGVFADGS